MRDIVATHPGRAGPDHPAPLAGVLVVQGGPGTGKTAVALHRAAYLLYTHRDRLARSGVLVRRARRPVFLRYIEQVLPSLGETGVVLATAGQLCPGRRRRPRRDRAEVAASRATLRMARGRRAAAVRGRQRVPARRCRSTSTATSTCASRRASSRDAARAARRQTGKPHNEARVAVRHSTCSTSCADQLAPGPRRARPATPTCARTLLDELRDRTGRPARGQPAVDAADRRPVLLTELLAARPARGRRRRASSPRASRPCCCAPPARPGPSTTSRCSTRPPSCSATTSRRGRRAARPRRPARPPSAPRRSSSPRRRSAATGSRPPRWSRRRRCWPTGSPRRPGARPLAERAARDRDWAFGHVGRRRGAGAVADGVAAARRRCPSAR